MSTENNGMTNLEELYSKRREKIEARLLLKQASTLNLIQIEHPESGGREFWYGDRLLGRNLFTIAAEMSSELVKELRAKVLQKAKIKPEVWEATVAAEDNATQDFEFRYSPQGSRTILVKRDNVELEQLLKLRVGSLFNYEPLRPADPRYRRIPWFEEFVTFQVPNAALAYRIIYSRVLQDSSSHLILDGSRLLSICLGKDDECDSGLYLNAFEKIDQLFLIFGFTETKNILHSDLVPSVFQRRKEAHRDCWVFLNAPGHLKSVYGLDVKPIHDASKVILL